MAELEEWVKENYQRAHDEGASWAELAAEADKYPAGADLAAWMRSQDNGAKPTARETAPKGRRTAAKSEG